MQVNVHFYSYFKDLTGCAATAAAVNHGATISDLLDHLETRFPKLVPMRNSTLIAVGVEYQERSYVIEEGDEISLFPPVQGG